MCGRVSDLGVACVRCLDPAEGLIGDPFPFCNQGHGRIHELAAVSFFDQSLNLRFSRPRAQVQDHPWVRELHCLWK